VFSINKRKAHVPLRSFTDLRQIYAFYDLLTPDPHLPRQLPLNGDSWRFHLADKPSLVPQRFWEPDFDASTWNKVRMNVVCPVESTIDPALCDQGG
jgi:hypothetical protein